MGQVKCDYCSKRKFARKPTQNSRWNWDITHYIPDGWNSILIKETSFVNVKKDSMSEFVRRKGQSIKANFCSNKCRQKWLVGLGKRFIVRKL